jgi:hypothetical protein
VRSRYARGPRPSDYQINGGSPLSLMGPPRSASCRRLARHRVGKLVITLEQQIYRIALALHLVTESLNLASGFRTSTDITRNTIQGRMLVVIEHTIPKPSSDSKSVEFDSQSDSSRP